MDYFARVFLFGLLWLSTLPATRSQWIQTSGPRGWQIQDMVSIGSVLYAGTSGGAVFVSTDAGFSWRSASSGLRSNMNGLLMLGSDGTILLAGTNSGLFRSTDGAYSWSSASEGLTSAYGWYYPCDMARLGTRIFLRTRDELFESVDDGRSWQPTRPGCPPGSAFASSRSKTFAIIDTFLFVGYSRGVYRTSVNSSAWASAYAGLPDTVVTAVTRVGNSLFVLASSKEYSSRQKVYRSTDFGESWLNASTGLPDTLYGSLKACESDLYQLEYEKVYRSHDMGTTWVLTSDTLSNIWTADGIRYAQKSYLQGTLIRSTDHGGTWAPFSEPPIGTTITALAAKGIQIVAATWNDASDFASTDRGNSWTGMGTGRVNLNVSCFSFCGPYLIAGGTSLDGGVDISTDNGLTWTRVTNGSDAQIEYFAVDSPYVFASGNGMWVSTDCGSSWTPSNAGLRSDALPYLGAMAILNSKVFVTEYWADSVFVSSDKGSSWEPTGRVGAGSVSITSLLAIGSELIAGTDGQGIWRSTDEGKSWIQTVAGLGDTIVNDIAASAGAVLAGTQDQGVFVSTDFGENWKSINEGLAALHINRVLVHDQDIYIGTRGEGVWRRSISEVTAAHRVEGSLPTEFRLEQNYPNPFNPTTELRYHLPVASFAKLVVYDLLGREVAVLVNERKSPGDYAVRFEGTGLASGVFVYRLTAGAFEQSRKMLLLR